MNREKVMLFVSAPIAVTILGITLNILVGRQSAAIIMGSLGVLILIIGTVLTRLSNNKRGTKHE